jgi:hypothetical protein
MKLIFFIFTSVLGLAGCSAGNDMAAPSASESATSSVTPSKSAEQVQVKLFFASDTGTSLRIYSEVASVTKTTGDLAVSAVNALLSGAQAKDADYQNLWGSGVTINNISIKGPIATIDLKQPTLNVGAEGEARAIDQVIWTLHSNQPSIVAVEFLIDGKPAESLAGHVDISGPIYLDEGYQSLATVDLDLEESQEISAPVNVTGLACTFEANVPWELIKGDEVINSGSVLASEACPTRSKFTIDLGDLVPGKFTLRVWESSMKDGSLINEDTKTFTVK